MQKSPIQLKRAPSIIDMMDEIYALKKELTDKIDAFDQTVRAVRQGPPGPRGLPGENGMSVDEEALAKKIIARMPKALNGADGKSYDPRVVEQLRREIQKLQKPDQRKLTIADIEGLQQAMNAFNSQLVNRGGYLHGGGDTVAAGSGVTITNTNGTKVISAAGVALSIIAVIGTIDDSNVSFTAASEPTLLNVNGAFYQKTGGSYTWTYVAGTITLNNPVGTGGQLFGI